MNETYGSDETQRRKEERISSQSPRTSHHRRHQLLHRRLSPLVLSLVGGSHLTVVWVSALCFTLVDTSAFIFWWSTRFRLRPKSVCWNSKSKFLRVIQIVVVSITLKSSVNLFVEFAFSIFKEKWSFSFLSRICFFCQCQCVFVCHVRLLFSETFTGKLLYLICVTNTRMDDKIRS